MGQAKLRGTREERVAEAVARKKEKQERRDAELAAARRAARMRAVQTRNTGKPLDQGSPVRVSSTGLRKLLLAGAIFSALPSIQTTKGGK